MRTKWHLLTKCFNVKWILSRKTFRLFQVISYINSLCSLCSINHKLLWKVSLSKVEVTSAWQIFSRWVIPSAVTENLIWTGSPSCSILRLLYIFSACLPLSLSLSLSVFHTFCILPLCTNPSYQHSGQCVCMSESVLVALWTCWRGFSGFSVAAECVPPFGEAQ